MTDMQQAAPLLRVNDIHVYYGAIHAIKGISLEVFENEGGKNISLSISHDNGAAIAFCCIEWEKAEGEV